MYIYVYIYISIYICIYITYIYYGFWFGLWTHVTSTECSIHGVNITCFKKRQLYTTKVSIIKKITRSLNMVVKKLNNRFYSTMFKLLFIFFIIKMYACNNMFKLEFHIFCNHQKYSLYYAVKITKIYAKSNTSNNVANNEIEF